MFSKKYTRHYPYSKFSPGNEFKGLPATSLGITSETRFMSGLDSAKDEYTTWDLFVVHVLRVTLNFTIFTYMRLLDIHTLIINTWELMSIVLFDLNYKISSHKRDPVKHYYQTIIDESIFYWETLLYIPWLFWKVFNPRTGTPVGLSRCREYIPKLNTPKSVALILQINQPMFHSPPEIPQPYLDADRKIRIPEKKEVQYVIAIRNEYFTQCKSHMAAERVRVLREIGRFITWCCLVPTITEISIYEKMGACWDGDSSFIDSIKNSILVELVALANTCDPSELKQFRKVLPQIVLLDKYTKATYVVNDEDSNIPNINTDVTVDDILSAYEDHKKLVVTLCDYRVKTANYEVLASKVVENNLQPDDPIFTEQIPTSPDLVFAPSNEGHQITRLCGYTSIDPNTEAKVKSVLYFSHIKFGYPFFSRAMYHYALEFPFKLLEEVPEPEEEEHPTMIPPSQDIAKIFKKISTSTLKQNAITNRISRVPSPQSLIAKSLA